MRLALFALLFAGAADAKPVGKPATHDPPPKATNTQLPGSHILPAYDARCHPARPGKQVGLLIDSSWGALGFTGWNVFPKTPPEPPASNANAYFFFADGQGDDAVAETREGRDIEAARANKWKLHDKAYLVELEIDGGAGFPEHYGPTTMVVTNVKDAGYKIDPTKVLDDSRARFGKLVADRASQIDSALDDARKNTPGMTGDLQAKNVYEATWPTWWNKTEQLEVLYVRKVLVQTTTQNYEVELGERFDYDKTGKLVGDHVYEPQAVQPMGHNMDCGYAQQQ